MHLLKLAGGLFLHMIFIIVFVKLIIKYENNQRMVESPTIDKNYG